MFHCYKTAVLTLFQVLSVSSLVPQFTFPLTLSWAKLRYSVHKLYQFVGRGRVLQFSVKRIFQERDGFSFFPPVLPQRNIKSSCTHHPIMSVQSFRTFNQKSYQKQSGLPDHPFSSVVVSLYFQNFSEISDTAMEKYSSHKICLLIEEILETKCF